MMKLPSLPRWAILSMTGGVVLLFVVVGLRYCGGKKPAVKSDHPAVTTDKKPDTRPEPVTTPALQRIESAIAVIQTGLADLAKGLANLNSRVKILEKRLASQATGGTSKRVATPTVSKSSPPVPSVTATPTTTTPPPAAAVDLTPVVEGLGQIADAIKETHTQLPTPTPDHTAEPLPTAPTPVSDNPCANWTDPARHRRCRLYNQLP